MSAGVPFTFRETLTDDVAGRYRTACWSAGAFYTDLLLGDLESLPGTVTPSVLDIGCGRGVAGFPEGQACVAARAGTYLGVEPDPATQPADCFDRVWRCRFEEAGIPPASVDLAYAAMVLEHVAEPAPFFSRLANVIRPGGVFWGFTVDRRHYFSWVSQAVERLQLKERYLDRVRGRRGQDAARYDNFPVHYRCNTPAALAALVAPHFTVQTWSLHRVGQLDGYVPYRLRRLSHLADRLVLRTGLPGSILVVRLWRRGPVPTGATGRGFAGNQER